MKKLTVLALLAGTFAMPALSFAQPTAGLTRAQVYAELVRIEQAGYRPVAGEEANYPQDIQAAEARIAAQDASRLASNAMGGVSDGNSQSLQLR